ncbi:TetR family transcriptional regulator [Agromyces luteolus]|uniref:TetR family transcriptional regulator n=2 Tax=Agromyces luteolus TaxID=88373 RepID=A0A7C9LIK9_9MICO|nr:TetR family transcriptional regulator [Agromyces luteolus]GLK27132.1 TetR family transcriptional regulator [Agromyces luteolus]
MEFPEVRKASTREGAAERRADAQRNRQRILTAARRLYATEGLGISMAAVSREAGVGKATLFRHFATVPDLVSAAFAEQMDAYVLATQEALAEDDAWWGFIRYVITVCEMQAGDRGFADVLTTALPGSADFEARRVQAYEGFLEVVERARSTGHLRDDFTSQDLILVLFANAGVVAATASEAPESWRRLIGHLIRGFAAEGAPTPSLPTPPDDEALYRAMTRDAPVAIRRR